MHSLIAITTLLVLYTQVKLSYECAPCAVEPLLTSNTELPFCGKHPTRYGNWKTCYIEAGPCNPFYKYRSHDGSCNNLHYPSMGMAETVFSRLLPSCYQNNRFSLAEGVTGHRPLARVIRTSFFPDMNDTDVVTLAVMQWGQITAHDLTLTLNPNKYTELDCCQLTPQTLEDYNRACLPIRIPRDDAFYSQFNVTCITIIRSNVTVIGNCRKNQPLQQINSVTHMMDGSQVYGSSVNVSSTLREFVGGRLRTNKFKDGGITLPNLPLASKKSVCTLKAIDEACYLAGDVRVNQNTELTVLQIALLRQHNRIAEKLQALHPLWNDETLYQEARSILIAMMQHITYGEWLVHYIGTENMKRNGLFPKKRGYTQYTGDINFSVINGFATAAYRVGHSGIQGFLKMLDYKRATLREVPVSEWLERPAIIGHANNFDEFLLGLTTQHMQLFDRFYTHQMTNHLFPEFRPFGQDLLSIDILRGRDHGLAPYIYYLELCTGHKVNTFDDLAPFISMKWRIKLQLYYKAVGDIDLIVGGLLESIVSKTRLGPTFLCVVTEQFYRTKWGDRFWYEVGGQTHSFTRRQLREIKKATLSRLLCDSGDNIAHVAPNSFLPPSLSNRIVPCSEIPAVDLNAWS